MTNRWVEFVRDFSKKHGITYSCAVSTPECKAEYRAKYPDVKGKKTFSKVEPVTPAKKKKSNLRLVEFLDEATPSTEPVPKKITIKKSTPAEPKKKSLKTTFEGEKVPLTLFSKKAFEKHLDERSDDELPAEFYMGEKDKLGGRMVLDKEGMPIGVLISKGGKWRLLTSTQDLLEKFGREKTEIYEKYGFGSVNGAGCGKSKVAPQPRQPRQHHQQPRPTPSNRLDLEDISFSSGVDSDISSRTNSGINSSIPSRISSRSSSSSGIKSDISSKVGSDIIGENVKTKKGKGRKLGAGSGFSKLDLKEKKKKLEEEKKRIKAEQKKNKELFAVLEENWEAGEYTDEEAAYLYDILVKDKKELKDEKKKIEERLYHIRLHLDDEPVETSVSGKPVPEPEKFADVTILGNEDSSSEEEGEEPNYKVGQYKGKGRKMKGGMMPDLDRRIREYAELVSKTMEELAEFYSKQDIYLEPDDEKQYNNVGDEIDEYFKNTFSKNLANETNFHNLRVKVQQNLNEFKRRLNMALKKKGKPEFK